MEFLRMQATQSERQYEFMSRICSLEVEKVTMKHEIEKINNKLLSSNNFNLQNVAQQNVHQAQPHMSQHYNMRNLQLLYQPNIKSSAEDYRNICKQLSLTTLNIECFTSNKAYLLTLMKTNSVIAIQEHFLYNCEKSKLEKFCSENNWSCLIKCVDDIDPISNYAKPRGMAGTAMLWSNKITEKITVLNEGSHRISAVTLSDDILDFNLYCVYMPCQNYSMDLFESTLDELGEIMTKYSNSTTIILGDMNASVNRSRVIAKIKL
ncbi:unnamed protein product [Mytilus edulis]|uniref:Endonuclease/exonuclease/phosphatase domain-containing protein n=1 Tax=Mytilus edulis TaxID=6550 RepID=A0A8S3UKJ9_MYTED|nr:unnamed protein product [Mytilus edulis]